MIKTVKKRRPAFILTEAVIACCLLILILTLTAEAVGTASLFYQKKRDLEMAESRAENILSMLRMPLYYCGAGLPSSAAEYKKAFNKKTSAPFSWNGPISVADEIDGRKDAVLRITYGQPDNSYIIDFTTAGDYKNELHFDKAPPTEYLSLGYYNPSSFLKNWLAAPDGPGRIPFYAVSQSGKKLTVNNYMEKDLSFKKRTRLLYIRALESYARGGIFYTNDFRTSGSQPRENGVIDARFRISGNMIRIYLLVRGENKALADAGAQARLKSWPSEYPEKLKSSEYPLYVFIYCLGLKNYDNDAPGGG